MYRTMEKHNNCIYIATEKSILPESNAVVMGLSTPVWPPFEFSYFSSASLDLKLETAAVSFDTTIIDSAEICFRIVALPESVGTFSRLVTPAKIFINTRRLGGSLMPLVAAKVGSVLDDVRRAV